MRVLITGFTGFVGSHLADYLVARGDVEVFGIYRWRSRMDNVEHLRDRVRLVECDLRDASAVRRVLRDVRPDRIFHLAAQSYVPTSWLAPGETLNGNVLGQLNLFEAMRELDLPTRVHIAGSSEEYGLVLPARGPDPGGEPAPAALPLRRLQGGPGPPRLPVLAELPASTCVRTRGFNHTGPRRGEVFVTSNFARQIAEIEKGLARAGGLGGQPRFGPGLHGRPRHGPGLLAGPRARACPARSTTSARAGATPRARCWTSCSTWPT